MKRESWEGINPAPDFIVTLEATAIPKIGSESEELLLEKDKRYESDKVIN